MAERKVARDADKRGEGICRTCLAPIWNEGGTIGHRKRDTGWSDRIETGGDSLVCFKAIEYRHVPLKGREAEIYDIALARGSTERGEPRGPEPVRFDPPLTEAEADAYWDAITDESPDQDQVNGSTT